MYHKVHAVQVSALELFAKMYRQACYLQHKQNKHAVKRIIKPKDN